MAGPRGIRHLLTVARVVEDRLVVFLHRRELAGADVEGVVDLLLGESWSGYRVAKVFDVEQLVAVVPRADHGEVVRCAPSRRVARRRRDARDLQTTWGG